MSNQAFHRWIVPALALAFAGCGGSDASFAGDDAAVDDDAADGAPSADGTGDDSMMADATADDSAIEDSSAEDSASADATTMDSMSADSMSADSTSVDSTSGDASSDSVTASDTASDALTADSASTDTATATDTATSACGPCSGGQVCCTAPYPCAGMCVPDCRLGGSCPGMLTCDSASGVCVPADAGAADSAGSDGGADTSTTDAADGSVTDSGSSDSASDSSSDACTVSSAAPATGSGIAEGRVPGASAFVSVVTGNAMGISGNTAAVGYEGIIGSSTGYVTVSVWNNCTSSWEQQQVVTGTSVTNQDGFGSTVSLAGDSLVVGAAYRNLGGGGSGGVWTFARSGTTWSQTQNLSPPTGAGGRFGWSIVQSGTTMAVGGPLGKDPTSIVTYTGTVEIYTKGPSGLWVARKLLVPAAAVTNDNFGHAVALDSGTLLASAPGGHTFPNTTGKPGKAWIYTGSVSTWTEGPELTASDGANNDWFGASVAITGNVAFVGAPAHDGAGTDAGAVYVFTKSGSTWSQTAKLTASDASANGYFGYTVAALSSTRVLVGAAGAGKLYTFTLSGSTWVQDTGTFTSCTGPVGWSLATSGDLAISGKVNGGRVFDLADPDRSCVGP